MPSSSLFRSLFAGLVLCLATTHAVLGQQPPEFKIVNILPTMGNEDIQIGHNWRKDLPRRMKVSVMVTADMPAASVFLKAYFYDKDNKLVHTSPKPNLIWASTGHGMEELGLPAALTHGKINDVFFALPEDLQAKKWTTMLVVFGNGSQVVANSLPNSALPKLEFPEKAKVAVK